MRIAVIEVQKNRPLSMDIVTIEDTEGNNYTLTDGQIEQLLIDDGQLKDHDD